MATSEGRIMNAVRRRSRLLPWYIGLAIVFPAVAYVAYQLRASGCAVPTPAVFMVLVVLPAVYLMLMYLTLTSQK
jgi:hypothetical protein